ncbi:hypothetical protein ZIOFF_003902 [Zingiber officinale]|uniref:Transposase-associated domain-containing protein n=1 Tax=Zingiber officinale TaxID=94328 RepID=A0A8J5IQ58_ZINOF|nr:hypothetical protein ZIOFF_003902 [Zingiber officinale]
MDKGWMFLPRQTEEYRKGLENFLDFAFSNANINGTIACPCARCKIGICVSREEAYDHLTVDGFIKGYTYWVAHGEIACSAPSISSSVLSRDDVDNMEGLVHDAFGVQQHDGSTINTAGFEKDKDIPFGEAEKFYKLIDDSQKELYLGCKKFSKLAFIIRFLHLKCLGKMTNKVFNMLLDLLREAFPNAMKDLPKSYYEAKKLMKQIGLGYEKIDACPNDCTLYWGLDKERVLCKTCNEPRWETSEDDPTGDKRKVAYCQNIQGASNNQIDETSNQKDNDVQGMPLKSKNVGKSYVQLQDGTNTQPQILIGNYTTRNSKKRGMPLKSKNVGKFHVQLQDRTNTQPQILIDKYTTRNSKKKDCQNIQGASNNQIDEASNQKDIELQASNKIVENDFMDEEFDQDSESESPNAKKKTRGPTFMKDIWGRPSTLPRIKIQCDGMGRPI